MSEIQLYQIAIGVLAAVITSLAGVIRHLFKKLDKREEQLIDFARRLENGDKKILTKIAEILEDYTQKKKTP